MLITIKANNAKEMKRILDALESVGLIEEVEISEESKISIPYIPSEPYNPTYNPPYIYTTEKTGTPPFIYTPTYTTDTVLLKT